MIVPHNSFGKMRYADLDVEQGVEHIADMVNSKRKGYCCIPNLHQCVLTQTNGLLARANANADLVMSDSRVLSAAMAMSRGKAPMTVERGDRILMRIIEQLDSGTGLALVGDTEETLENLATLLHSIAPNLEVVFTFSPRHSENVVELDLNLCRKINASGAGFVAVGMGCPKQEIWMYNYSEHLDAYLIGVGAAFSYLTGRIKSAPRFVHQIGFEWVVRILADPKRMFRRNAETFFPFVLLWFKEVYLNLRKG